MVARLRPECMVREASVRQLHGLCALKVRCGITPSLLLLLTLDADPAVSPRDDLSHTIAVVVGTLVCS